MSQRHKPDAPAMSVMGNKRWRFALNAYLFFIGIITLLYGFRATRIARNWALSDWLINYEGGFVRRGLPGEITYQISHLLHMSGTTFTLLYFYGLYAAILLSFRALALDASRRFWVAAVILSPATLGFPILNVGAGFRKEIIYLAAFGLFVATLRRTKPSGLVITLYLAVVLSIAVLSHEALICFAPYFFAALLLSGSSIARSAKLCVIPFALALALAFLCSRHIGSHSTAVSICSSLGYPLQHVETNQICGGGAIGYLTVTPAMAKAQTSMLAREHHYLTIYPLLALLAIAPLVAGSIRLAQAGYRREVWTLWSLAAVSLLGTGVLFLFAVDWGRWIYIHVISISMLLLLIDASRLHHASLATRTQTHPRSKMTILLAATALFCYSTLWTLQPVSILPSRDIESMRFGYVDLGRYMLFFGRNLIKRH